MKLEKKMSDAKKGENYNNFGHNHNEEIRKKKCRMLERKNS
jgi:hypothetical protein